MQARVLNVQVPAERCQERMTAYTDLLTTAGDAPGCAGSLLVGDDTTGEMMLITLWDDEEAMAASADLFGELTSTCSYLEAAVPERRVFEVRHRS